MINKGRSQHRFKNNPIEKIFAEVWDKQNNSIRKGRGTLDYLLADKGNDPNGEVTKRDREVAATVIQWLGSPVGQWFLSEVEEEKKKLS